MASDLLGIPLRAPWWRADHVDAASSDDVVHVAPWTVAAEVDVVTRALCRGFACHVADEFASRGKDARQHVVVRARRELVAPSAPWDLPLLLSVLPKPAAHDVVVCTHVMHRNGGFVVDVAALDRVRGTVKETTVGPVAVGELAACVSERAIALSSSKSRAGRAAQQTTTSPQMPLHMPPTPLSVAAKAKLLPLFLAMTGHVDDSAVTGVDELVASLMFDGDQETVAVERAILAAVEKLRERLRSSTPPT